MNTPISFEGLLADDMGSEPVWQGDRMDPLFKFHKLNDDGKTTAVALAFNNLLAELKAVCPEGRELSIVKTKLEEACFFAKKSIAVDPKNQA